MGATADAMRNMLMYWGAVVSGFGMLGSPLLLKSLSRRTYTTITNLSVRSKPTDRPGTTTL